MFALVEVFSMLAIEHRALVVDFDLANMNINSSWLCCSSHVCTIVLTASSLTSGKSLQQGDGFFYLCG